MSAIPLDGFPPAFFPRCPKCDSGSLHFQRTKHPFMWGKTDLQFSCFTCGLVKYGEPAIRQAFEGALAKWERQWKEEVAFQVSVDKERAERVAREVETTRLRREQEARQQVEVEAKRAKEAKEAARTAREQKKVQAQEEAARKVREEQERIVRERDAALLAREQELARERAARWAEIEVMRKRDAERQANLQRELKRERDTRYREKKRAARLSLSPVAVLPAPVSQPAAPVVVEVEVGVVEEVGSVSLPMCAWTGCANHATPTSKYCSRTCSNNNARARYAARRAELPAPAPEAKGEVANAELRKEVLARKARYEARTTTESV